MARKERTSRGRMMRPNYFVFCEGETEMAYVGWLRTKYRAPIQIIARKTLLNITPELIARCKQLYVQTRSDKTYLMYDLDVESMWERLQKIPNVTLLVSNPCFELWLLLHHVDQQSALSSVECVKRLEVLDPAYRKGGLSTTMVIALNEHCQEAIARAKRLTTYANPSATVYQIVEDLNQVINPEN